MWKSNASFVWKRCPYTRFNHYLIETSHKSSTMCIFLPSLFVWRHHHTRHIHFSIFSCRFFFLVFFLVSFCLVLFCFCSHIIWPTSRQGKGQVTGCPTVVILVQFITTMGHEESGFYSVKHNHVWQIDCFIGTNESNAFWINVNHVERNANN